MHESYFIESPSLAVRTIYRIFPELQLQSTPWQHLWHQRRRDESTKYMRFTCLCASVGYAAHVYVDQKLNLDPVWLWLSYRLGLALVCLGVILWTFTPAYAKARFYKLPYAAAVVLTSYLQAKSVLWSDLIPVFFAFVIPCMGIWGMQSSLGMSLALLAVVFGCQYESLGAYSARQGDGFFYSYLVSSYIISFLVLSLARSSMHMKVSSFLAERQLDEERAKVANTQIELVNQLKSFVPQEIFARIMRYKASHRSTSLLAAIDEILRTRKTKIACLWSDIRNFTESCKIEHYIEKSAVPNIQRCTNIVESQQGIPRLVGDLILAYWDEGGALAQCLRAGFLVMEEHIKRNLELPDHLQVRRFIILSWGEGYVGNIGGIGSSREITCLGSTVNLLSRIDLVTKKESFAAHIPEICIIMTDSFAREITKFFPQLVTWQVDLAALNIKIKNFPDETQLWIVEDNPDNRRLILSEEFVSFGLRTYEGADSIEPYRTAI